LAAFSFCTERQIFLDIDRDVSKKVSDYEHWVGRKTQDVSAEKLMTIIGIPSMRQLFERTKAQSENEARTTGGANYVGSLKVAASAIPAARYHTFP
jgi:hypothetical protein